MDTSCFLIVNHLVCGAKDVEDQTYKESSPIQSIEEYQNCYGKSTNSIDKVLPMPSAERKAMVMITYRD